LREVGIPPAGIEPATTVDVNRLRGEAHHLDRLQVDLYRDEPTLARDLVEDLLAMIPGIRTMRSERGEWWRAPS
jgi:hypothetical protein